VLPEVGGCCQRWGGAARGGGCCQGCRAVGRRSNKHKADKRGSNPVGWPVLTLSFIPEPPPPSSASSFAFFFFALFSALSPPRLPVHLGRPLLPPSSSSSSPWVSPPLCALWVSLHCHRVPVLPLRLLLRLLLLDARLRPPTVASDAGLYACGTPNPARDNTRTQSVHRSTEDCPSGVLNL